MSSKRSRIFFLVISVAMLLGAKGGGKPPSEPLSENVARAGDTVLMMVANSEPGIAINKATATATITDKDSVSHTVFVRNLVRLYPDPTSAYNVRSAIGYNWPDPKPLEVANSPFQGHWLAIIDLHEPITDAIPELATGLATVTLSSEIGDRTIPLEIVSGTGAPNSFSEIYAFADHPTLDGLEPMPQLSVTAEGIAGSTVGGGVFLFSYDTADFESYTAPQVRLLTNDTNVQVMTRSENQPDGTTDLHVMLMNSRGFKINDIADAELANGMSLRRDLRFTLVWDRSVTIVSGQDPIQLSDHYYFDLNGIAMNELTAIPTKLF